MNKSWGHHVSISIYLPGAKPSSDDVAEAVQAATEALEHKQDVEFAGASIDQVQVKPEDQVNS